MKIALEAPDQIVENLALSLGWPEGDRKAQAAEWVLSLVREKAAQIVDDNAYRVAREQAEARKAAVVPAITVGVV